ncbi:MAG: hypothetical protein H6711_15455 [Myxococcales bacterium]|nr:hypothetical protein [Myxococcales bacterium]
MALLVACPTTREQHLTAEGNALIERIEAFRRVHHRLPDSLAELGIVETEEGPLYYQRLTVDDYTLHFGTALGDSRIYRSDRQTWGSHH